MKSKEKITVEVNDPNNVCYIKIGGVEVRCSREVYLTIKRPIRKEAMRECRGQRSFINGKRCKEDCKSCVNYAFGACQLASEISLDKLYKDDGIEITASSNVELDAEASILAEKMFNELDDEEPRYKEILSLMIQEYPQRDIAEQLCISDGTVTYFIKKIRAKLNKFR